MKSNIFFLRELAHSRAGDKGDTSNVSVIAYHEDFFESIVAQVTEQEVRAHFGSLVKGAITRYELPQFHAMNFVLENALGGGVTRSLSLDPHGKSYSALILTMPILVSNNIAELLRTSGRTPIDMALLLRLQSVNRLPRLIKESIT